MKYTIEIDHEDDGSITPTFRNVGSSDEDRARIARALRQIASDLVDDETIVVAHQ